MCDDLFALCSTESGNTNNDAAPSACPGRERSARCCRLADNAAAKHPDRFSRAAVSFVPSSTQRTTGRRAARGAVRELPQVESLGRRGPRHPSPQQYTAAVFFCFFFNVSVPPSHNFRSAGRPRRLLGRCEVRRYASKHNAHRSTQAPRFQTRHTPMFGHCSPKLHASARAETEQAQTQACPARPTYDCVTPPLNQRRTRQTESRE